MLLSLLLSGCSTKINNEPQDKSESAARQTMQKSEESDMNDTLEIITLGAGCFWCIEAIYEELKGIHHVESGYSGGSLEHPTYEQICEGNTGHAEVAQIHFDPTIIDLTDILNVFWTTHDPTTLNRQGNDIGTQYRSAIFYHNEEQKNLAVASKDNANSELWDGKIVTEIVPFETFYQAEKKHQDFYAQNQNYGYCRAVINPKLEKFRKKYAHMLKKQ